VEFTLSLKHQTNFLCLESVCQSGKSANFQAYSLCFTFLIDGVYRLVQPVCSILGAKKQSCFIYVYVFKFLMCIWNYTLFSLLFVNSTEETL
jgi:hypothetical protein